MFKINNIFLLNLVNAVSVTKQIQAEATRTLKQQSESSIIPDL